MLYTTGCQGQSIEIVLGTYMLIGGRIIETRNDRSFFWCCAKASSPMLFNLARAQLAQETVKGALAIMKTHPHHWSQGWFRLGSDCDSVDYNIFESSKKGIIEARCLPIISSLESIRQKLMIRIQENKTKSEK